MIQVLTKTDETDGHERFSGLSDGTDWSVRAAGPGQWFIVGNDPKPQHELTTLMGTLQPAAYAIDQSAGRVRIHAEGTMVERVLCKGTAVELAIAAFPTDHSVTTRVGHITAHLTRTGENAFEIMVLRGFAESLWDDLARMCAEYL